MRQITIKWRLSEHMTAGDFRKRLRSVNGVELPKLLFWHDESGQTVRCGHTRAQSGDASTVEKKRDRIDNSARKRGPRTEAALLDDSRASDDAMPTIRFFHSKSFVGIHFLGSEMIEFASRNIALLIDSARQALGPVEFEVQEPDLEMKPRLTPRTYFIPSLALRNPSFEFISVEQYCERIIQQDLRRQAAILGIDAPDNLYVRVTSIGDPGTHWVRTNSGQKTGGALRLKDVKFITNADLKGSWSAGSLISKGFGSILNPAATAAMSLRGSNE